ncbi:MAG: flavodoxin domain-containing protein [Firmicutes bacterium]|nr:flavodoxin domain-containing protein [Bacillota bacterium]
MHNKTVVLYRSKTGFARQYAKWISQDLHCDMFDAFKIKYEDLDKYHIIIYGAGLYAKGINGLKKMKKKFALLKDKNIIVFATGATLDQEEDIKNIQKSNFTEKEINTLKFFYLRGGFDYKRLSLKNKFMMTLLKMKIRMQKHLTDNEESYLDAFQKPVDYTNKEYLMPLLEYVHSFSKTNKK